MIFQNILFYLKKNVIMLYRHESLHIVHNRSHFFPKKIMLQQQKFMSTIPPAKLKKKYIIYSTKKPTANIESKYEIIIKEAIHDKRLDKIRSLIHHQQQLGEERHKVIKLDRFQTWRPLLLMIRKSEQIEDLKWLETMIYEQKMITLYGLVPDLFDYHALMYCYGVQQQIDKAEQVIQKMYQQYKLTPSVYTNNTLLGCYQRNGDIDKALTFLQQQKEKGQPLKLDIASYNTVLAMLDKKERYQEALDLYDQLPFSPDRYTYSNMLRIVTQLKDTTRGNAIYNHLYKLLIDHHHQSTNQQQQLPKINHYHHNKKQFHRNHKNKSIDISTINAMLAYQVSVMKNMDIVLNIYNEDLLPLYKHYDYLKPNTITCNIILDGVLKLQQNAGKASSLYHDMVYVHSFLQPDLTTFGILMDAKGLIGGSDSDNTSNRYTIQKQDISDALDLYEEAIATVKKTNKFKNDLFEEKKGDILENNPLVIRLISSLAVIVSNLSYNNINNNNNIKDDNDTTMDRLWELFITKWQRIIFHKKTYHGFLYGFAKAGRADLAQALYDRVFRYNTLCDADIVTYTGLMVAYIQSNQTNVAIEIYEVLKNHHYQSTESSSTSTKVQLDDVFFTTLISTMTNKISQLSCMDKIEKEMEFTLDMFMDMRSLRIQPHLHTYTAMLNCCGRAKHAEGLEQVHQLIKMDLHLDPDIAIYNALLDGYNRTDQIDRVLNLWDIMSTTSTTINSHQLMFDAATISIVLDACGHHNESLRGQSIWNFLNQIQYPLNTNHFNSYIEFLCRVGDGTVRNRKHQSNSELGKKYWLLAYKLMINEKMKLRFFPNEKTLNTLLSFARKYNIDQNLEIQQKIEKMKCV